LRKGDAELDGKKRERERGERERGREREREREREGEREERNITENERLNGTPLGKFDNINYSRKIKHRFLMEIQLGRRLGRRIKIDR